MNRPAFDQNGSLFTHKGAFMEVGQGRHPTAFYPPQNLNLASGQSERDQEMEDKFESDPDFSKLASTKGCSWIPNNLAEKEKPTYDVSRDSEFIKYRLNNPRVTKKGDKVVSEGMCNAYFEQRRNVLTKLLKSFNDTDVVIHPLVKKFKQKNYRSKTVGSKFRGVSKNKHKWQVMIMGNFKKFYIGGIKSELEAAKLYDKLAIFYHGMEAKTNFQYTKKDIEVLIDEPMDA